MAGYVLSPLAEEDLRGINRYTIREHGVEQFRTYRAYINKALKEVAENPMCLGSKERDDLVKGCRSYRVQHHYLFYRLGGDRIQIGRVLHGAMNFEEHIFEGDFNTKD